jgi:glycosyltransferase involved in cell wall biosynthesis
MADREATCTVSVIVPVRDGSQDLAELIACLDRQTVDRAHFEVVVGDDGSTEEQTGSFETSDGHVRVVEGPPQNSYAARNRAVAASRGAILAFCDADCRPEPDWLAKGVAALTSTDLAAGRIRFSVPKRRTVWTLVDMDGSKDHEHQVRVGVAETANLFLRRDLFDTVGGFEAEVPEYGDYDFVERCVAAGAALAYAHDATVWHPARTSPRALLRALWKYNHGYAMREGRAGRIPDGVRLRAWVPIVQTFRARKRWGRSIGPDRRWLAANGVEPTRAETLRVLLVMYLLLPYVCSIAQVFGWLSGLKLRRIASAPAAAR